MPTSAIYVLLCSPTGDSPRLRRLELPPDASLKTIASKLDQSNANETRACVIGTSAVPPRTWLQWNGRKLKPWKPTPSARLQQLASANLL